MNIGRRKWICDYIQQLHVTLPSETEKFVNIWDLKY